MVSIFLLHCHQPPLHPSTLPPTCSHLHRNTPTIIHEAAFLQTNSCRFLRRTCVPLQQASLHLTSNTSRYIPWHVEDSVCMWVCTKNTPTHTQKEIAQKMDEVWVTYILTPPQKKTSTTLLTKAKGQNNVLFSSVTVFLFFFFSSSCQYNTFFDTLNVATIILSLKWHKQAYINVAHCVLQYSETPTNQSLWPCVAWRAW